MEIQNTITFTQKLFELYPAQMIYIITFTILIILYWVNIIRKAIKIKKERTISSYVDHEVEVLQENFTKIKNEHKDESIIEKSQLENFNQPLSISESYTSNIKDDLKVISHLNYIDNNKSQSEEFADNNVKNVAKEINKNKYVLYDTTLLKNEFQNIQYPIVHLPDNNCIVRSYQIGKNQIRGYKEEHFENELIDYFGDEFEILGNIRLNTGNDTLPYEPDIAIIDEKSGLNIRIDIEIDEPYTGISRNAIHCIGDDDARDLYFKYRGWIVIRFTEHQVHTNSEKCIEYIERIIARINPNYIFKSFVNYTLLEEDRWDLLKAQEYEKARYRETYLEHEFGRIEVNYEIIDTSLNDIIIEEENQVTSYSYGQNENIELISYNKVNSDIDRDQRVKFFPEEHLYTIDDIPSISVSQLISKHFNQFNAYNAALNLNPNHKLYGLSPEHIVNKWTNEGFQSALKGTELHNNIENYYLGNEYSNSTEFQYFLNFINDMNLIKPYRTEWRIFDTTYQVAGTIDFLYKNQQGNYDMIDWKRSKNLIDYYGDVEKINLFGKRGIGDLNHLHDTSYVKYCLQQSIYKLILESNYGITIDNQFLIVLHEKYNNYKIIEAIYLENEAKYILESNKYKI